MPTHALVQDGNPDITVAVYQHSIQLTDAQIKALPTTPIEVIPAKGPNTVIMLHSAFLYMNENAGLYTNQSGTTCNIGFYYGALVSQGYASVLINNNWLPFFDSG